MAMFPVLGYQFVVSTAPPPPTPGSTPPEFTPRVFITISTNLGPKQIQLPINAPDEFLAICALMQVPGRLVFDDVQATLEKITP